MIVHLDTSALVGAFAGSRPGLPRLMELLSHGHRLVLSTIALYEWERGPRSQDELEVQGTVVPAGQVHAFGAEEASLAAELYRSVRHARGRDLDLAIAACAILQNAGLWTLNRRDFEDIPGLRLI